ncbi:MAG: DUF1499 domain-containing protein [Tabrizicola sp.]
MARLALWFLLAGVVALALYVRLAPSDPARWHVTPGAGGPWGEIVAGDNSASARLGPDVGPPGDLLARLDAIALATPRTTRLAGSVESGRITWVTRSRIWGFPDYTTAEARADGLYLLARSRFGQRDLGVNAARLTDWLARLQAS